MDHDAGIVAEQAEQENKGKGVDIREMLQGKCRQIVTQEKCTHSWEPSNLA